MKKILSFINKKYYLKFILYMVIFALLAIGIFHLDQQIQGSSYNQALGFSQSFLNNFLIMMIASIITMVTITFSNIMVVLTLYSGQFSPRTLNDFLERKVPLNILGFFIGTTVYAIISLIMIQNDETILFSNLTSFSIVLFILSIVLFAYYIQYVSKSVQINYYLDSVVEDAVHIIDKYQKEIDDDPSIVLEKSEKSEEKNYDQEYKTKLSGYLIDVDKDKLLKYLKEHDLFISVVVPLNVHVYEGDILFKYCNAKSKFNFDEEMIEDCFVISKEVGSYSEYRNKTLKLTEIAVRALSPGTNDPKTAMICVHQLGYVFMKLSDAYYHLQYHDEDQVERLLIKTLSYDDLLYDHFYQIYLYGKHDLMIISSMIKAFTKIASDSNQEMKSALWKFALYILKDLDLNKLHDLDYKEIDVELRKLADRCHLMDAYKKLMDKENK